VIFRY